MISYRVFTAFLSSFSISKFVEYRYLFVFLNFFCCVVLICNPVPSQYVDLKSASYARSGLQIPNNL